MYKTPECRSKFGSWDVEKVHAVVARSIFRRQKCKKTDGFGALSAGFRDYAPGQKWAKREGFVAFPKRWQAWDICRGSRKMSFMWQAQYKWHVHQSCSEVRALISWEGLHFGASDLQVCWDDFVWQVQRFRQVERKNRRTHWYEAVSSANFAFLKEVSQNCFAFDVVSFENWGSFAELFRFWCCLLRKLRKSPSIVLFLMLSSSKNEKASPNCFALDFVKFNNLGFAELFCFWCCQVQKLRTLRRIVLRPAPPKLEYIYI